MNEDFIGELSHLAIQDRSEKKTDYHYYIVVNNYFRLNHCYIRCGYS